MAKHHGKHLPIHTKHGKRKHGPHFGGMKQGHFGMAPAPRSQIKQPPPLITYMPQSLAFFAQSMDVFPANAGSPFFPPNNPARYTGTAILITGTFLEGTRQKIQTGFGYTHVVLCDPAIVIKDAWAGFGSNIGSNNDLIAIPSGAANYWLVTFSFVTEIAGLGRRKVVLLQRAGSGAVGDWSKLV